MIDGYFNKIAETLEKMNRQMIYITSYLIRTCKGTIYVFGNGGSASTASHFAQDMSKEHHCRMVCLNDSMPSMLAYGNDMGFDTVFKEPLLRVIREDDLVIGISCSGNSPNVLEALKTAKEKGILTIGFSGMGGGEIDKIVDYNLHVPSNDMQICEDIHLMLTHVIFKIYNNEWP